MKPRGNMPSWDMYVLTFIGLTSHPILCAYINKEV
jgi:hypothetical protein